MDLQWNWHKPCRPWNCRIYLQKFWESYNFIILFFIFYFTIPNFLTYVGSKWWKFVLYNLSTQLVKRKKNNIDNKIPWAYWTERASVLTNVNRIINLWIDTWFRPIMFLDRNGWNFFQQFPGYIHRKHNFFE